MTERSLATITNYLAHQGIEAVAVPHRQFAISAHDTKLQSVSWSTIGFVSGDSNPPSAERMSIASMAAVEQLDIPVDEPMTLLDMCAAPGMKSLYALLTHSNIEVHANDISEDRLIRLKSLYKKHGVRAERITKCKGEMLTNLYEVESFDRIILDAPCSGEGGNTGR